MTTMKQKLLLLLTVLLSSASAWSAVGDEFTMSPWSYKVTGEYKVQITGYSGSQSNVTIPDEVTYKSEPYNVVGIGSEAFKDNTNLKSITIPYGVTSISGSAFYGCTSLTSVSLPEGFWGISAGAFYNCTSLTSITIPGNSDRAYIGQMAFYGCTSLKTVTVSGPYIDIEKDAFKGCTNVTDVYYYYGDSEQLIGTVWNDDNCDDFKPGKATKCHVRADQLDKCNAYWNTGDDLLDVNVTFVGDLDCPVLTDGEAYTRTIESKVNTATYQKTLGSASVGKHQAWLVPFDYTITSADLAKFSFYKINMIANSPSPDVEATDEAWVFLTKMAAGDKMYANMPYAYKPKTAVTNYQFTSTNVKLRAPNSEVLAKTESMRDIYSFYATYQPTSPRLGFDFYYVNNNGGLTYGYGDDSGITVEPYRWIIHPDKKGTYDYNYNYAPEIHFVDGDATGMIAPLNEKGEIRSEKWYTIDGRKLQGKPTQKGMYIVNGTKVVIK